MLLYGSNILRMTFIQHLESASTVDKGIVSHIVEMAIVI